ncbi:MAG: hypothetical protein V1774_11705, partial [Candidatus Eisenbacteria bacterium]
MKSCSAGKAAGQGMPCAGMRCSFCATPCPAHAGKRPGERGTILLLALLLGIAIACDAPSRAFAAPGSGGSAIGSKSGAINGDNGLLSGLATDNLGRTDLGALTDGTSAGPSVGKAGTAKRGWERLLDMPLVRRVVSIGKWIASLLRFLWSIPKAVLQGDSHQMIEALGDLLARTTPA